MVSAHYLAHRIRFLKIVLDAIAGWSMDHVRVVLVSNDPAIGLEEEIERTRQEYAGKGWQLDLEIPERLTHPFHLTWHHRQFIQPWLESARDEDDLFVYLEDDIVVTRENLDYFRECRKLLAPSRLVPSFLRYETTDHGMISVDLVREQVIGLEKTIDVGGRRFIAPSNPYWAGYVLDKQLGEEFVGTPSFDLERSASVYDWGVRERAAMGLAWESPPSPFRSRQVVPLADGRPESRCLIWHCAQNYYTDQANKMGKLPLDKAFVGITPLALLSRGRNRLERMIGSPDRSDR